MPGPLQLAIRELGHDVELVKDHYRCLCCGQTWQSDKRRMVIQRGRCPGPSVWGYRQRDLDIPRKLPVGSSLVYAGQTIHESHRLGYIRGLLFCWGCGHYSGGVRVKKLTEVCLMRPPNATAERGLSNIRRGLHPDSRQDLALPASYPPPPAWLDGNGQDGIRSLGV